MHECVVSASVLCLCGPFSLSHLSFSVLSVYNACVVYSPASYDRLAGVTPAGLVFH